MTEFTRKLDFFAYKIFRVCEIALCNCNVSIPNNFYDELVKVKNTVLKGRDKYEVALNLCGIPIPHGFRDELELVEEVYPNDKNKCELVLIKFGISIPFRFNDIVEILEKLIPFKIVNKDHEIEKTQTTNYYRRDEYEMDRCMISNRPTNTFTNISRKEQQSKERSNRVENIKVDRKDNVVKKRVVNTNRSITKNRQEGTVNTSINQKPQIATKEKKHQVDRPKEKKHQVDRPKEKKHQVARPKEKKHQVARPKENGKRNVVKKRIENTNRSMATNRQKGKVNISVNKKPQIVPKGEKNQADKPKENSIIPPEKPRKENTRVPVEDKKEYDREKIRKRLIIRIKKLQNRRLGKKRRINK